MEMLDVWAIKSRINDVNDGRTGSARYYRLHTVYNVHLVVKLLGKHTETAGVYREGMLLLHGSRIIATP